jgi:hypothetical protein
VIRNLQISTILTFTDVMAVSIIKRNYETMDNEPRTTESSSINSVPHLLCNGARGDIVVKALRYKTAGRGFDSRWCHWNFSVT